MKYKNQLLITAISLAAGIACVLLNKIAPATIVIILGATFIASGVLNIALMFSKSKAGEEEKRPSFTGFITSLAAAILGLWLVVAPEDNIALITRIFSILILLGSGYLIFSMLIYFRNVNFHYSFYIIPSLLFAVGIWMLVSPLTFAGFLVLMIGIVLIVYGIATGLELLIILAFERRLKHKQETIDDIPDDAVKELDE